MKAEDRLNDHIDYLEVRSAELRELSRYYRRLSRILQARARYAIATSERLTNPRLYNPPNLHPEISREAAAFTDEVLIPVAA